MTVQPSPEPCPQYDDEMMHASLGKKKNLNLGVLWERDRKKVDELVEKFLGKLATTTVSSSRNEFDKTTEELTTEKDQVISLITSRLDHFQECSAFGVFEKNPIDIVKQLAHSSKQLDALFIKRNNQWALKDVPYYTLRLDTALSGWKSAQEALASGATNKNVVMKSKLLSTFEHKPLAKIENAVLRYELLIGAEEIAQVAHTALQTRIELKEAVEVVVDVPVIRERLNAVARLQAANEYQESGKQLAMTEGLLNQSRYPSLARGYFFPQLSELQKKQHELVRSVFNKKFALAVAAGGISAGLAATMLDHVARKNRHYSDAELKKLAWHQRYPSVFVRSLGMKRHLPQQITS